MLSKEKIESAKWYLSDYGHITLSSDLREAVVTVLEYIKELEEENKQLKETKVYK